MTKGEEMDVEDLETTFAAWRTEAHNACHPSLSAPDLDWLAGRIGALDDVLACLSDGTTVAPIEKLLGKTTGQR